VEAKTNIFVTFDRDYVQSIKVAKATVALKKGRRKLKWPNI